MRPVWRHRLDKRDVSAEFAAGAAVVSVANVLVPMVRTISQRCPVPEPILRIARFIEDIHDDDDDARQPPGQRCTICSNEVLMTDDMEVLRAQYCPMCKLACHPTCIRRLRSDVAGVPSSLEGCGEHRGFCEHIARCQPSKGERVVVPLVSGRLY
jgi:hypothetical protein